ncbi:hypothetical protein FRC12_001012 [Ceratobasidium sp. 428]|nr:hypothetical protein FRC12_001012 [Ceratobasidium sp. 428]
MPHLLVHHDEATLTDSAFAIIQTGHSNNRARSTHGPLSDFYLKNQGLLTIALSQLFFSMMYMGVKVLTMLDTLVPTLELVAVRMGMTWICCQVYMISLGIPDPILGPKGVRGWLATRGVVGFFGIFGLYYSLQYMSLSDATVLTFLAPSITALLGFTILHEPISRGQVVAGLTSLLGVVLIARPASLFGDQHADKKGINLEVTESQRMTAVW